jgi:hypothetical protein
MIWVGRDLKGEFRDLLITQNALGGALGNQKNLSSGWSVFFRVICLAGRKLFHTILNLVINIQIAFVTRFLEAEPWFCSCLGRVSLTLRILPWRVHFWLAGRQPGYRNTFIVSNSDSCSSLRGVLGVTCTGRHRCHVFYDKCHCSRSCASCVFVRVPFDVYFAIIRRISAKQSDGGNKPEG